MRIPRGGFLPNLCTLGNGICGYAAIAATLQVAIVQSESGARFDRPELFASAAWMILLGMVFDVFDGKLARLTGRTSDLGAQLDSLCDAVTFGLAPALLVLRMNELQHELWRKVVWFLCLSYFLGALLRLARFNAENDHDESAHLCFKGLPSPGAAGCVATLVVFYRYVMEFRQRELVWLGELGMQETVQSLAAWIPRLLPILLLGLGYTMVSNRLRYEHIAGRLLHRPHSFEFLVSVIFASVLLAVVPEVVLPVAFVGYLVLTPVQLLVRAIKARKRGVEHPDASPSPGVDR